jgi:hypothetical protein
METSGMVFFSVWKDGSIQREYRHIAGHYFTFTDHRPAGTLHPGVRLELPVQPDSDVQFAAQSGPSKEHLGG